MPLVLAFLGAYFLLFTVTAFVSNPRWVSEILPPARSRGCAVLRVHHPDRSAHLARQISGPDRVRRHRRRRQLRFFRMGRRRLLSARRRACRQCVGSLAPHHPPHPPQGHAAISRVKEVRLTAAPPLTRHAHQYASTKFRALFTPRPQQHAPVTPSSPQNGCYFFGHE